MLPLIHIINDEDSVRASLKALIEAYGWKADAYATGSEFLSTLSEPDAAHPECLLVDIQLLDVSGLDLLSELNRRKTSIPTIFMTGNNDEELQSRAAEQNAIACFQKPFDSSELLNTISSILAPAT